MVQFDDEAFKSMGRFKKHYQFDDVKSNAISQPNFFVSYLSNILSPAS